MPDKKKIIYMGRGGTPYMRVPEHIPPDEACIGSVKRVIKDETERLKMIERIATLTAEHRKLIEAVLAEETPGMEYTAGEKAIFALAAAQLKEQQDD